MEHSSRQSVGVAAGLACIFLAVYLAASARAPSRVPGQPVGAPVRETFRKEPTTAVEATRAVRGSPSWCSADSPFGIHGPKVPDRPFDGPPLYGKLPPGFDTPREVRAAGAGWARYCGFEGLVWDLVEKSNGTYDWSRTDYLFGEASRSGLNLVVVVHVFNVRDQPQTRPRTTGGFTAIPTRVPRDMAAYLAFLEKAVGRYRGSTLGSPSVVYWEIENEPDFEVFFGDSPEAYARLLAASARAIRKANPAARVLCAGTAGPGAKPGFNAFFPRVFTELDRLQTDPAERFFDVFSFHVYNELAASPLLLRKHVKRLRAELSRWGYAEVPLWLTETATHSGLPSDAPPHARPRSEAEQATDLFKVYLGAGAAGVSKVFWVTLTEWSGFGGVTNGFWDNVGLIHNPRNGGLPHRKLAYYTFRKLAEVLDGCELRDTAAVRERGGVFVYKLARKGRAVWAAWSDLATARNITIPGVASRSVRITEAVPDVQFAENATGDGTRFRTEERPVANGAVVIHLERVPLLIEEK